MSGAWNGKETRRPPELLAPAGSREALRAAIAAGADAVYLGGKRFGARHYAANFTPEEMEEAVRVSHLAGVRVYVTVNTLIREKELIEALSFLFDLYRMGVDGVIIQDTGLLALARKAVPGLVLHASTQATIATPEGAAWAKAAGYSRVILPRELTLDELDGILALPREKRPEIEVFVHGALCYSYSGQCLLSSLIGGRSGNRGMCAQPCRKPYLLVEMVPRRGDGRQGDRVLRTGGRYLLSTRDLCCYQGLDRLFQREIAALKIEGRMRSPAYVAIVVRAYRRALDALQKGNAHYRPEDEEAMALAFSRGFTGGFILGDPNLMGREAPGNRGLFLGTVRAVVPGKGLLIRAATQILPAAGDGILVAASGGEPRGGFSLKAGSSRREGELFIPASGQGARPGDLVYLTRRRSFGEIMKDITGEGRIQRPVTVDLGVTITTGEPVRWKASVVHPAGGRIPIEGSAGEIPVPARTQPLSPGTVRSQLGKTGDSPFAFRDISVAMGKDAFLPLSSLNRIRREILDRLERGWIAAFQPHPAELGAARSAVAAVVREMTTQQAGYARATEGNVRPVITVYCATPGELEAACRSGCDAVRFEPTAGNGKDDWEGEVHGGARRCREAGVHFAWMWPRVAPPAFVRRELDRLTDLFSRGVAGIMADETGLAEAIRARVPGMEVLGGPGLNIVNSEAALFLHPPIDRFTLSPEVPCADIPVLISRAVTRCPGVSFEVICQGSIEAMVSRNRLLPDLLGKPGPGHYGLRDETGRVFPVYEDRLGRTRILNAAETTLIDHVPFLIDAGVRSLAIDARRRGPAYIREVVPAYRKAVDLCHAGEPEPETLEPLKERIRRVARGGLTEGHFVRSSY
ncbi:MAG: U32 family peptidase [Methanolinea sp.]|jgi:putative protease|nr:U32 family peptidase [Methanolinea sp.]